MATTTKNKKLTNKQIYNLALGGILMGIVVLMSFTPIGYLKIGVMSISFLTIPVAIGGVSLGPWGGTLLGLTFGLTSFIQCFMGDPTGSLMLQINPAFTAIVCILTRTIMGHLCGLIGKAMRKTKAPAAIKYVIPSISAPVLNTLLFMTAFIGLFWETDIFKGITKQLGTTNVLTVALSLVGVQALVEAAVCTLVSTLVCIALSQAVRNFEK